MTEKQTNRGGAAVGFLTELDPVEAAAVVYLRLWCTGHETKAMARQDFEQTLGQEYGASIAQALEQLCDACMHYGRRPLMRHHIECKCLGGDEACFANFIAAASEGAREDAFLFASNILRPDMAMCLVNCAERFGLGLKQMNLGPIRVKEPQQTNATLH